MNQLQLLRNLIFSFETPGNNNRTFSSVCDIIKNTLGINSEKVFHEEIQKVGDSFQFDTTLGITPKHVWDWMLECMEV